MLTLIQFPWSPFCITIRHILERHRIPHHICNIPNHDRTAVIQATNGRAYTVPCLVDGKTTVADFTDFGQEVARHVDAKYKIGLFPADKEGIQLILAQYIEGQLEDIGFRVNDSEIIPKLPLVERVMVTRHKERKFGKGCVQQWARDRRQLCAEFATRLAPMDSVLAGSPYLLGDRPLFVDYDLYGILGNYLYSGKTKLPALKHLRHWYKRM
ncbi:MAG: glutathione S-transferase family protein [Verrucomicrobia bacterium]|nr:glutathione S-transferase family protein [Verrucomicrobiota bacterium]